MQDIKGMELPAFKDSKITIKMDANKPDVRQQTWIFHDKDTNPRNTVVARMSYAHGVVYVGGHDETKINEALHDFRTCGAAFEVRYANNP